MAASTSAHPRQKPWSPPLLGNVHRSEGPSSAGWERGLRWSKRHAAQDFVHETLHHLLVALTLENVNHGEECEREWKHEALKVRRGFNSQVYKAVYNTHATALEEQGPLSCRFFGLSASRAVMSRQRLMDDSRPMDDVPGLLIGSASKGRGAVLPHFLSSLQMSRSCGFA